MKTVPNSRSPGNGPKRRKPTMPSPFPILDEMLASDGIDALLHNMEIEFMTPDDIRDAFALDMTEDEYVEMSWRNSWEEIGASLRCVMREHLGSLPESERSRIEHMLEQ